MNILYDIYSIVWREIKRYSKSKFGVLIRLIQPLIWIIVVGNTFTETSPLIASVGFSGDYMQFITPGIIILTAIFTSIFGGVNTLWDRRYGFINKVLISPISRSSIALGKMIAISIIATVQSCLILGISFLIGVAIPTYFNLLFVITVIILFSLGFSGISVIVASLARSQETFWATINFLGMPLFMLSPALFPLELLPPWLSTVAKLNPVTYTIILIRDVMNEQTNTSHLEIGLFIIICFAFIITIIASFVFTRDMKKPF